MTEWLNPSSPATRQDVADLATQIQHLRKDIHTLMATTASGLAALQQADADLATAVAANTAANTAILADVATLISQLNSSTEDASVLTIAADLETKVATLQANTAALTAAVTPATPAPASS